MSGGGPLTPVFAGPPDLVRDDQFLEAVLGRDAVMLSRFCRYGLLRMHGQDRLLRALTLLALGLAGATASVGQTNRSALDGMVRDASGLPLPGVRIVVLETSTGFQRELESTSTGSYYAADLPIGIYRITCTAPGFRQSIFENVVQTVGRTRTLDIRMTIGAEIQQVKVTGAGSPFDRSSATLGASIDPEQVKELPLNGRNWSTLTALTPGAVDSGGSNQRSVRFAGRGLDDNNFTLDGIDATNVVNQAQQPFVRLAIPLDAIEEFRTDTMIFTAENGSTPGGQIAVASKAGSNQFHGSVFEFIRNDVFDAREPIDSLNPTKPAFRLNQFGAAFGGPLVHDRSFFHANYEGIRQNLGQTLPGFVPSDTFRAEVAAKNPALVPILNAYPKGTLPMGGSTEIAEFVGSGHQIDNEDSAMLRLDHRFSNADSSYLRFAFDAARYEAPMAGGASFLDDRQSIASRPVNGELEYLHVFSPRLIDETKLGFNRGDVYTTNESSLGLPLTVAVSGFTTLNNNQFKLGVGNTFSWIDDLTFVHAGHTLKLGVEIRRIQLNQGNTASGTVTFTSADNLLANSVSSATYALPLPVNGLRKTQIYNYVQDQWKLRSDLTANIGVRYSFFDLFHEVHGKAIPFDFATCGPPGFCGAGASFGTRNTLDFDPRIAFTWSPSPLHDKTILRAGFGLYHGDGQLDDQNLPISNEVGQYSLSVKTTPGLSFPIAGFLNGPGTVSARDDDRRRKDSYATEWGLSVQQALPGDLAGSLAYAGSKGTYLLSTSYVNLIDRATGERPNSNFGQVQWRGNTNSSAYHSFSATLKRSFSHGLLLSANYVWSHEIDQDAAGGGDSDYPQNPACTSCERASGDFDARHVFNANAVFDLPFGWPHSPHSFSSRIAHSAFDRWRVAPVVMARSGLPVNVTEDRSSSTVATGYTTNQRPDRAVGVPLTPVGGHSRGLWINPAAFVLVARPGYGNAPRNVARGPGLWQADMALVKEVSVTDRVAVTLRGEIFNLLNRAQYGLPAVDLSTSAFGEILNTVNTGPVGTGTPRQLQFSLRLGF